MMALIIKFSNLGLSAIAASVFCRRFSPKTNLAARKAIRHAALRIDFGGAKSPDHRPNNVAEGRHRASVVLDEADVRCALLHPVFGQSWESRPVKHGAKTAALVWGESHHLAPYLVAFHAEVDAGGGRGEFSRFPVDESIQLCAAWTEIAAFAVESVDEFVAVDGGLREADRGDLFQWWQEAQSAERYPGDGFGGHGFEQGGDGIGEIGLAIKASKSMPLPPPFS
jgi:hypothetical protein